jgi:hypothetical protein
MHRIVVDVQTGQVTQVELTAEEIAAIEAAQAPVEAPVETPAEPSAEQ